MCGFTGYINSKNIDPTLLEKMGELISHRGPDSSGIWVDQELGIGVCHRRLSILDLSEAGHQPMLSKSKRFIIAFNGEIYNYQNIKDDLEKEKPTLWNGHSDTEIILEGFERWGVDETLGKMVGMFSISLIDRDNKLLYLIRDRAGEKPLYFGWQDSNFFFGSELKSFHVHPGFKKQICKNALADFFRYNYIPSNKSIYVGIKKLNPGTVYQYNFDTKEELEYSYWSITNLKPKDSEFGTSENYVSQLDELLKKTIKDQMITDVPLGAFLSGGVDSSTIVAIMQEISTVPVKTFSIGFDEAEYDEAVYAKEVAKHLGTEHTELYVSPKDAMDVIPLLPKIYDEPFSDSSQIPTFLVAQLAKKQVTVSLSGDAGDELFGGYNRYLLTQNTWDKISKIPMPLRNMVAKSLLSIDVEKIDSVYNLTKIFVPKKYQLSNFGHKAHKAAGVLNSMDISTLYQGLITHWNPESIINGLNEENQKHKFNIDKSISNIENMMLWDFQTYLPDDILVKVDRAAMSTSLETRVPFLDHRIIEFAMNLEIGQKIKNGTGKWLLREVLFRYVPKNLIERPKKGFGIPLDQWLRGPLKDWVYETLSESNLKKHGLLNIQEINRKVEEHMSRKYNWQYLIWDVLMFQSWFNEYHSCKKEQ
jgi:asparagine synthase (glutamine-hydrolysing)